MAQLVTWDPFRDLMNLQRDVNRMFSNMGTPSAFVGAKAQGWVPTLDVIARGDDLVLRCEIPGVDPQNVEVTVTEGVLTITGERHEETTSEQGDYLMKESSSGAFQRAMRLPEGVDPESIRATFKHGVLEVTIPHAAAKQAPTTRRIPVQAGHPMGQQRQTADTTQQQMPAGMTQRPQAHANQQPIAEGQRPSSPQPTQTYGTARAPYGGQEGVQSTQTIGGQEGAQAQQATGDQQSAQAPQTTPDEAQQPQRRGLFHRG